MSLKTADQISTVAKFKLLIQADARNLTATGAKFNYFSKFTFGDNSTSPVIFFGGIGTDVAKAVAKQGKGPATGQATINDNDEIVLETTGTVLYGALAKALKGFGVIRTLSIPSGALELEKASASDSNGGTGDGPNPTPSVPKLKSPTLPPLQRTTNVGTPNNPGLRRPLVRPTNQTSNPPVPQNRTTPPTVPGNNTVSPTTTSPLTPPVRRPLVKTGVPTNNPSVTPPQNQPTTPLTRRPLVRPNPNNPQPNVNPNVPPQGKGPVTNNPPNKPPNKVPPSPLTGPTPKAIFQTRYNNLKVRYELAIKDDPNNESLKSLWSGMIVTAKKADFAGALHDAAKLDLALSKTSFQKVKTERQETRAARLTESFGAVKKSYFNVGTSDNLAKEKLNAGTHFKAFLKAQKAFETARDEKTLAALEEAALAYGAHFTKDFNDKDRKKSENIRKNSICETALKGARHFRLALEQDKLGNPPWDEETEMRAAELYTQLLFEQDDTKLAKPNDPGAGVNGAFWIDQTVWGNKPGQEKESKTFIFKPGDAEGLVAGFPRGGSVAREMLGKTVGDQLQSMMGLDFGVPETTVISVDATKLQDDKVFEPGARRPGSIQHFATSSGELKTRIENDPTFLTKIPDDEVQKMAVLDLIQLNMDRHSGNFMVDDDNGKKPARLVPIDNGVAIPSLLGLKARRTKMCPPHAILGKSPASDKKLPPEMVEKIKQIDPDAVVEGMKKSFKAMSKLHPGAAQASGITEENFELTKRSILFMKKASTELTLAEIQDAYMGNLEEIFESSAQEMEAGFTKAIQATKARAAATKELKPHLLSGVAANALRDQLRAQGWGMKVSEQAFESWILMNPEKVLKIYKGKIVNQAAVKEVAHMRDMLKDTKPEKAVTKGEGLFKDYANMQTDFDFLRNAKALKYNLPKSVVNGEKAEIFEDYGGDEKMKELDPNGQAKTLDEKLKLVALAPYQRLGGDQELAKALKEFPAIKPKDQFEKIKTLRMWKKYQDLGGSNAYLRLGGSEENQQLHLRVQELPSMLEVLTA